MHLPTLIRLATASTLLGSQPQQPLLESTRSRRPPDLPGGSPFSLCPASSSTDVFQVTMAHAELQPVYIDDYTVVHFYGNFLRSPGPNATITVYVDCGSYCEEDDHAPMETPVELFQLDFCEMVQIDQPLGRGAVNGTSCPPQEGYGLVSAVIWIWPMFLPWPGHYNFTIDVQTAKGGRVFCLGSEVCLKWLDEGKNEQYRPGFDCTYPR